MALAAWRDRALGGRDGLRLPPADGLHITLVFLGDRSQEEVPELARTALAAVGGRRSPVLSGAGVVGVPRRRPRLFALDLEARGEGASGLQAAVVDALAAAGLHEPEARPFWPHVTLARVRDARGRGLDTVADVRPRPEPPSLPLVFDRVTLFRSHLHPSGARYEVVERRSLHPAS